MKLDRYSKVVLTLIAAALFAILAGRSSQGSPAAPALPDGAGQPYRNLEFIPQSANGFIAINRRTGDFSFYQLNAPNNKWKWEKLGPTGRLAELDPAPATPP